jgi:hypothetical protein
VDSIQILIDDKRAWVAQIVRQDPDFFSGLLAPT